MKNGGLIDTSHFADDIARVLVPRRRIATRIEQLAGEMTRYYEGREITLLTVLTGALVFVSDLIRHLPLKLTVEPVSVSSYPDQAVRSQGPTFRLPPSHSLAGRHVLIADDIYDSGLTMQFLVDAVNQAQAASVRSAVLLRKDRPDLDHRPAEPHFVGFDIPDEFVVGYGLDFDNLYRNLPDICVLRQHDSQEQSP